MKPNLRREELASMRRSLADHPGLYTASLMTGAGALAGVSGNMATALGYVQAALVGAAIMGLFSWVPVLWTAWRRRKNYYNGGV